MLRRPLEPKQYNSAESRATLKRLRVRASTGRVGSCFDDAVAESLFGSMNAEIGTQIWATPARHAGRTYVISTGTKVNSYRYDPYGIQMNVSQTVSNP